MKTFVTSLKTRRTYETPQAEIIEIESQGVLCASGNPGPSTSTNPVGNGIHFGTSDGQW
jgi:hypothetical protein